MNAEERARIRRELGLVGRAFLWVLGRPLTEPSEPVSHGQLILSPQMRMYWKMHVCPGTIAYFHRAPNCFHRGMQWLAFGMRWRCEL